MENKVLIDLSVKYGLDASALTKITNIAYQSGITDLNSREFTRIANYLCEMGLLERPEEEIMEELKLKGLVK